MEVRKTDRETFPLKHGGAQTDLTVLHDEMIDLDFFLSWIPFLRLRLTGSFRSNRLAERRHVLLDLADVAAGRAGFIGDLRAVNQDFLDDKLVRQGGLQIHFDLGIGQFERALGLETRRIADHQPFEPTLSGKGGKVHGIDFNGGPSDLRPHGLDSCLDHRVKVNTDHCQSHDEEENDDNADLQKSLHVTPPLLYSRRGQLDKRTASRRSSWRP